MDNSLLSIIWGSVAVTLCQHVVKTHLSQDASKYWLLWNQWCRDSNCKNSTCKSHQTVSIDPPSKVLCSLLHTQTFPLSSPFTPSPSAEEDTVQVPLMWSTSVLTCTEFNIVLFSAAKSASVQLKKKKTKNKLCKKWNRVSKVRRTEKR